MITAHHLVFGRKYVKEETATWGSNSTFFRAYVSTREDNIVVDWQDGSTETYTTLKNTDFTTTPPTTGAGSIVRNYSTAQVRNIQFKVAKGLKDIYSIAFSGVGTVGVNAYYILDWSYFINQFNNLYSLYFNLPDSNQDIIGDLSQIPNSLERIQINNLQLQNNNDFYLNVSNFSQNSKLKYFNSPTASYKNFVNIYGDLSKLPPQIQFFSLAQNNANTFTYTAGRSWSSSFDTLNIGNARLSTTDTDNLLIDLNNSITTAIGNKVINLANCLRSSTSDTAVAGLTAKGFTVTCTSIGAKHTITFDLGQNVTINGTVTRAEGHDGRLNAIQFGSGNLVSADPLPASQVWSIAFWMKSGANNTGTAQILTNAVSAQTSDRLFGIFFNIGGVDSQICASAFTHNVAFNNLGKTTGEAILNNTWRHYVIIIDTTKPAAGEISIYIDKVGKTLNKLYNTDNTYTFKSSQIQIGLNHNSTASMSPIKMFNYPLTQTEIDNLYNE